MLSILFVLFMVPVFCQYQVSGLIRDNADLKAVESVNVSLCNAVGDEIMAVESDEDGRYLLENIQEGAYSLKIRKTTFEEIRILNISVTENIELPVIFLYEGSYIWDVTTQKQKRSGKKSKEKIDLGYNVGLIEKNPGIKEFEFASPEDPGFIFRYKVVSGKLEIDFTDLVKN